MTDIPPCGESPQPGSWIMLVLLFVVVVLVGALFIWVMGTALTCEGRGLATNAYK